MWPASSRGTLRSCTVPDAEAPAKHAQRAHKGHWARQDIYHKCWQAHIGEGMG